MRILYVSSALSWRGGEQQLVYLYEELRKKSIEQIILCPEGSELEKYCRERDWNYQVHKKRSSFDIRFSQKVAKIVKQEKVDIVNPHDSHAHTFTILAASLFKMQVPIVLHRKVDYPVSSSPFSRLKYNHSQIKKIICISEEVKRVLQSSIKHPEKCIVIKDGIDLDRFENKDREWLYTEFQISRTKTLIGNISAITQQKDYFTFVKTAALILKETADVHFLIAGEGDQSEVIKKMVKDYGLEDHFTFTGFRKDIHKILPCIDILLFTSEKEGLGTTVLDAFAAMVPVVSTNAGGIPEIITHEVNGFLAEVADPVQLAKGVFKLMNEPGTSKQYIQNAAKVVKDYSREITAEKTRTIFESTLV